MLTTLTVNDNMPLSVMRSGRSCARRHSRIAAASLRLATLMSSPHHLRLFLVLSSHVHLYLHLHLHHCPRKHLLTQQMTSRDSSPRLHQQQRRHQRLRPSAAQRGRNADRHRPQTCLDPWYPHHLPVHCSHAVGGRFHPKPQARSQA